MKEFYTSDLHIGHLRAAHKRGFETTEQMHEHILYEWNKVVGVNDTVWVVGDLSIEHADIDDIRYVLRRLNGRINLILGNHDAHKIVEILAHEELISAYSQMAITRHLTESNIPVTIHALHYPMFIWKNPETVIHAYGHMHSMVIQHFHNALHIGWESYKRPISIEEICKETFIKNNTMMTNSKDIILIIDPQNDFVLPEKGSLCVPGALEDMTRLQVFLRRKRNSLQQIVSMDWHPEDHQSFEMWNKHCVADTFGSEIYEPLRNLLINPTIIKKGVDRDVEMYSPFTNGLNQDILDIIRNHTGKVYVCGEAKDVCVLNTLIDIFDTDKLSSTIVLLTDCSSNVLGEGAGAEAFDDLARRGLVLSNSTDIL